MDDTHLDPATHRRPRDVFEGSRYSEANDGTAITNNQVRVGNFPAMLTGPNLVLYFVIRPHDKMITPSTVANRFAQSCG